MTGEIEKPVVIGKAEKPQCFKNTDIKELPIVWKAIKSVDDISYHGGMIDSISCKDETTVKCSHVFGHCNMSSSY
jgi:hypothetical protein